MSSNKRVFGQATKRGPTRYQRQTGNNVSSSHSAPTPSEEQERAQRRLALKLKRKAEDEALDQRFGYNRYTYHSADGYKSRRGWVFNILPTVSFMFLFENIHTGTLLVFLTIIIHFLFRQFHRLVPLLVPPLLQIQPLQDLNEQVLICTFLETMDRLSNPRFCMIRIFISSQIHQREMECFRIQKKKTLYFSNL